MKIKTLKTTLLLLAMLIANTTFSQSKEETKEWLNINGLKLVNSSQGSHNLKYTLENDTLTVYAIDESCNLKNFSKVCIKDFLFENYETLKKRNVHTCELKAIDIRLNNKKSIEFSRDKKSENDSFIFFYYDEENTKRVIKAIMHLAKLGGAKENKQTF